MNRRQAIKVTIKLGLTALLLGVVFKLVGAKEVWTAVRAVAPWDWVISITLFCTLHTAASLKWRLFMRLCGGRIETATAVRCYAAGLFANLCLPSMIGGDVLRAGLAMQAARQKESIVLGSLVDRFSDFLGLALVALWGLLIVIGSHLNGGDSVDTGKKILTAFFISATLLIVGVLVLTRVRPKASWSPRLRYSLLRAALAIRKIRRRPFVALFGLILSAALQVGLLLVHRRLAGTMNLDTSLATWLFIWPLAKIAAMLPVSLGGIGVREGVFASLGKGFGMPPPLAVAASLAWQAVLISGGLLGGIVWGTSRLKLAPRPLARPIETSPS